MGTHLTFLILFEKKLVIRENVNFFDSKSWIFAPKTTILLSQNTVTLQRGKRRDGTSYSTPRRRNIRVLMQENAEKNKIFDESWYFVDVRLPESVISLQNRRSRPVAFASYPTNLVVRQTRSSSSYLLWKSLWDHYTVAQYAEKNKILLTDLELHLTCSIFAVFRMLESKGFAPGKRLR